MIVTHKCKATLFILLCKKDNTTYIKTKVRKNKSIKLSNYAIVRKPIKQNNTICFEFHEYNSKEKMYAITLIMNTPTD
jgi:hypothetical protein